MKIRQPNYNELNKWEENGQMHLLFLWSVNKMWKLGILKTGHKKMIEGEIFKRWDRTHEEKNPYNPLFDAFVELNEGVKA